MTFTAGSTSFQRDRATFSAAEAGKRVQRLSNRDVPVREGLSYLHDFVARSVAGLQFTPQDRDNFEFALAARSLDGDTIVGTARYSPVRGERTRELIADGRNNYMLTIHDEDYESARPGGGTLSVKAGDVVIVSESMRHSFSLPGTKLTAIVLDERRLASLAPDVRKRPMHRIAADTPSAGLIAGYANLLLGEAPVEAAAARLASNHLYQLTALALNHNGSPSEPDLPGIGGARLALIKKDIASNATDPDLNIIDIARRQRVTARYVQRLFEREGTSFGQYLRDLRLDFVRAQIEAGDDRTISTIAFDIGFGDLSHFNKGFRQRFGATPTEIRAQALRDLK